MPNHLVDQTSPYLRQHKDNPVDWYPWNDEAFLFYLKQSNSRLAKINSCPISQAKN
ncbi:MAG: DUF255 domain-containing protein [Chloroflexota bacterium]|nr:DUF255 domain-containing protein [Chloroflexota bacterium]